MQHITYVCSGQGPKEIQKDHVPHSQRLVERSDRKDLSHSRGWYSKPREVGRHYQGWSTESKAELTSSKTRRRVTWPWARVLQKFHMLTFTEGQHMKQQPDCLTHLRALAPYSESNDQYDSTSFISTSTLFSSSSFSSSSSPTLLCSLSSLSSIHPFYTLQPYTLTRHLHVYIDMAIDMAHIH